MRIRGRMELGLRGGVEAEGAELERLACFCTCAPTHVRACVRACSRCGGDAQVHANEVRCIVELDSSVRSVSCFLFFPPPSLIR